MTSEIVAYEGADFGEIRTVTIDGKIWFVAMDIARNLAYRDAAAMTRYLPEDEKGYTSLCTPGGEQQVSIVSESGLYRACMTRETSYIKDAATREHVEAFQRWILHEVLPGLRETGFYLNVPPEQLGPAAYEKLVAYMMAANAARIAALEAENDEMRPKAEMVDVMMGSSDTILVRELAQLLTQAGFSVSQKDMFALLHRDGFLIKANAHDRNQPTRKSIERGLFEVRETVLEYGGGVHIRRTPRVTPEGQRYFLRRYAGGETLPGLEVVA